MHKKYFTLVIVTLWSNNCIKGGQENISPYGSGKPTLNEVTRTDTLKDVRRELDQMKKDHAVLKDDLDVLIEKSGHAAGFPLKKFLGEKNLFVRFIYKTEDYFSNFLNRTGFINFVNTVFSKIQK